MTNIEEAIEKLAEQIEKFDGRLQDRPRAELEEDYITVMNGLKTMAAYSEELGSRYVELQSAYSELVEYVEEINGAVNGRN